VPIILHLASLRWGAVLVKTKLLFPGDAAALYSWVFGSLSSVWTHLYQSSEVCN